MAFALIAIATTGAIAWPVAEAASTAQVAGAQMRVGSPIFTLAPYDRTLQRERPYTALGKSHPVPAGILHRRREGVAPVNAHIAAWSAAFSLMAGGLTAPPQAARDLAGITP